MLSHKFRSIRFAGVGLCFVLALGFFAFLLSNNNPAAAQSAADLEKQMEQLKSQLERPGVNSPDLVNRYNRLAAMINDCSPSGQLIKTFKANDPLAPQANLCINGSLDVPDPDHNRVLMVTTGTGIGNGTVGNCSLSGSATAANHDVYSFNLTGCAAFPTEVTATLCGPAGCQHVGNVDTAMILYRNVAAGDPLTANGGLPGVFNPAAPCTNARAANDDLNTAAGTANNTGGSTCNQTATTQCVAPCTSPSNAGGLSGFRRQLGNGRFTLVVSGFGNGTTGAYNLYIDAPAAGCAVSLAPSAAAASISGRALTQSGRGISKAVVTVTGGTLASPMVLRTNPFGYFEAPNLEAGQTYNVSIEAKGLTFTSPTRIVSTQDSITQVDFTSIE